jgi:uncharacterized protein (DUF58 family)
VIWLRVNESLPVELMGHASFKHALSLGPKGMARFSYALFAHKRGYYKIGPLNASSGDLFGLLGERRMEGSTEYLAVYPKIVPFTHFWLPSRSPQGTMRYTQPIFEDPTRVIGKRDYATGDSLRRVDWKATAVSGRLQVKKYEPSIALESSIFLNLNSADYEIKQRYDATELAIVLAASIANWVSMQKQAVGLVTNGVDIRQHDALVDTVRAARERMVMPIPPRKGRAHLMRILEILACVQFEETIPLGELIRREHVYLPWGTTVVLITGLIDDALFDQLFPISRTGLNVVLIHVGQRSCTDEIRQRAKYFKFPLYQVRNEFDLDIWRK